MSEPATPPASGGETPAITPAPGTEAPPASAPAAAAASSPGSCNSATPEAPDPVAEMRARGRSPELAAFLAWVLPGLGHIYAGYARKGVLSLVLILGLWGWGIALSRGEAISLDPEEGHPYAFVAQVGGGLPTLLVVLRSKGLLPGVAPPTPVPGHRSDPEWIARLPDQDTGLLFTMVAGLLNLLLIYDALQGVPGAIARRAEEARIKRRIEALRQELAAKTSGSGPTEELPPAAAPAAQEAP